MAQSTQTDLLAVELDVATEATGFRASDLRDDLTRDLRVDAEVVDPAGPGGGNPIVRFVGKPEQLLVLLYRYYEGDLRSVTHTWNAGVDAYNP